MYKTEKKVCARLAGYKQLSKFDREKLFNFLKLFTSKTGCSKNYF